MRGLSGNLTNMDKTSIYRAASENYPTFVEALNKNLADGKITEAQAAKWKEEVDTYVISQGEVNDLIFDEDKNIILNEDQQDRLIEKITQRNALQARIDEDPNNPLIEDLKRELEEVNESINSERNIIKSENSQTEIDYNNYLIKSN